MNAWPLPPNPASSMQLMVWIMIGKSVTVWLSGGDPILRLLWYDLFAGAVGRC